MNTGAAAKYCIFCGRLFCILAFATPSDSLQQWDASVPPSVRPHHLDGKGVKKLVGGRRRSRTDQIQPGWMEAGGNGLTAQTLSGSPIRPIVSGEAGVSLKKL
jgi:hypothetical protein